MPLMARKLPQGGRGCVRCPLPAPLLPPLAETGGLTQPPHPHTGELRPRVWEVLGFPRPVSPVSHNERPLGGDRATPFFELSPSMRGHRLSVSHLLSPQ